MSKTDRKMAVLRHLRTLSTPISLPELQTQLPLPTSERTLRRWLGELVDAGYIERLGQKRGTRYRVQRDPGSPEQLSPFSHISSEIVERTRRPLYARDPIAYNLDWFYSYRPNSSYYLPEILRAQLQAAGTRSSKHDPAGTYARQIYNRLLIDLSFNSSRLEGNTYSLAETERLLLEGASAEGKLDEEKVMILNHKEGIRYLVEQAFKLDVSSQTILTMHYLLADGLLESQECGAVREHAVRIGGSTYRPYEDPKTILQQLERIGNVAEEIRDPYEQSFFLLAHISYLQAFADANKRTARLCSNIPLVKHNLVPLSFNDIVREDYTSAIIAIYEEQAVEPLADLYAFSYLRTCAAYDVTVEAMGFDEVRVRYRSVRRRLIRHVVLELLTGQDLADYIKDQSIEQIPARDRADYVEDVLEDLEQLAPERIAGMGITETDLRLWQTAYRKNAEEERGD